MTTCEALIKRIPKGGTRSVKALARQLGYLSRQNDDEREDVPVVGAQRHAFNPGGLDAIDPNDVWAFARRVYERSGRLPPDDPNGELDHDLTMHFVISFPEGTEPGAAERAGRDWAEYVFGQGHRTDQGHMQRHDYVTVFHNHGSDPDHPHPHVHVVVDRVPLGGGHLLTLRRGHTHWSYEAMRVQAVEAAANHGIELVATTRADRGLTERPMTDVQFRQFQRRLMQRPITQDEADRRRADAATVPYYDPDFDANGLAPDPNEIPDDPTRETVLQSCEPIMVPIPAGAAAAGGGGGPGGGGGGPGGGPGGNNQDDRRRRSPGPSLPSYGGGDDGDDGRSSGPGVGSGGGNEGLQVQSRDEFEFGDDDVMNNGGAEEGLRQSEGSASRAQPNGGGSGSEQQQPSQDNARKRKRTGEPSRQEPDQGETQQQQSRGSADRQRPDLTAAALRQLNQRQAATVVAARTRDANRWLEDAARADPPLEEDNRHLDNGPAAAPGPTSEAERIRDAQRRAERDRREQDDRDTDDRRRKTPDQQARVRKRRHEDDQSGFAKKRARTDLTGAGPSAPAGGAGNQPTGSQQPPNQDGQNSSRPPRDPVQERRQTATRRRHAALEALRDHRRTGGEAAGNMPQAWRERERALQREARLALIEQRRAHAGTNLETRAQARARQAEEQRREEHGQEVNTNDRGAGRRNRPDPGSRSGNTRGR